MNLPPKAMRWTVGAGLLVACAALFTNRVRSASLHAATGSRAASAVAAAPTATPAPRTFVGSDACKGCHSQAFAAWQTSHHRHAMEHASEESVLGDFNGTTFTYFGRVTRFFKDGASFKLTTENQQGQRETFTVAYTLGRAPLQQYLVRFADGRIQALPFAWDTRAKESGGQRWFHLYPDADVTPSDPLFWTRPQQNWNHLCGDCHTTSYSKGFSATEQRFDSRFSELGNGCESCHGPGSAHLLATADKSAKGAAHADLAIHTPRGQAAELDQCGVCHARRVRLLEGAPLERLHETWRPELLGEGLYFSDGQIQDEVFEVGSFLQSKMASRGVTCGNCHDPHTAKLKAEGNALCTQCHEQRRYDTPEHHFHPMSTAGAACVNCHMPTRTYMVVHERRDHRIAVPRPDRSDTLGAPNACAKCHQERGNAWAADVIRRRRPQGDAGLASAEPFGSAYGPALFDVRNERADAVTAVRSMLANLAVGPIAKASALAGFGNHPAPDSPSLLAAAARDDEPWVRLGAVEAARSLPPPARQPILRERLTDPSRAVRLAVAPLYAGADKSGLSASDQRALAQVFAEYRAFLRLSADRADALVSLGNFERALGDLGAARAALEQALKRDDTSLIAHLNLADLERSASNDRAAEVLLRRVTSLYPESADAHYALGLLLVRKREGELGVSELGRATELAPKNSQYAYAHAVGLYSTGRTEPALSALNEARRSFPENQAIKAALAGYCAQQRGAYAELCR